MTIDELKKHKKILIIGYGVEGKAVEVFLKKNIPAAIIGIADMQDGKNYLDKQSEYDLAIKSPGIKPDLLSIPYTTGTNIFISNYKGKSIGVTGTKGKSTTTVLIYEMLKKQGKDVYLGGNIGEPPINFLDKLNEDSWSVLELSSFQLQDIKKSPNIAVVLMIKHDHLDYHKDIKEYVDAKRNILRFQKVTDYAIINRDYPASVESDVETLGKIFYISRERITDVDCFVADSSIWIKEKEKNEKVIEIEDLLLLGKHNIENVCAAIIAAKIAGVQIKNIAEVLKTFRGLEHRLEYVGERYGIQFYNDSLSTIPDASIEAIEAFDDKVKTLIAGGFDRGVDYKELGEYLVKSNVKTLILFGPAGVRIWKEVVDVKGAEKIKKIDADSMHQAVFFASEETESGNICLLSPAAPSFGMFTNYKDRGDQFKMEVNKL